MLKVLAIGDPHFKAEERRTRGNKYFTDKLRDATLDTIRAEKPNIVVVMGDTLDRFSHIHTVPLTDATDWFYDMAKLVEKVFVLIGNHDRPSADDFMSKYHPFTGIRNHKKITIISRTTTYYSKLLDRYFIFVPYVPPGRFKEALSTSEVAASEVAAIFAHQEFRSCKYRGITSKKGDVWPESAPLVVSGHIHNYQYLGTNILYIGTPMQHDFGETDKKSISLLTFMNGENGMHRKHKRLYLNLLERRELTISVDEIRSSYRTFLSVSPLSAPVIIWKITIKGAQSDVDEFTDSKKGKRLQEDGVLVFPWYTSVSETTKDDTVFDENFETSLIRRIKDDQDQLDWLERILKS